jgi:RNA polymerase sigma-70 factor (ECF subfamily)
MTELAEPTNIPGGPDMTRVFEDLRVPLTGYCYRMLGSYSDAEDAVQDTMVRAWRSLDRLDGPAALKPWIYRIATNVCLTLLDGRRRRALPMDLVDPSDGSTKAGPPLPESTWIQPAPDARVLRTSVDTADPAERAVASESIRIAFIAALQHLPARQRAVLILRDVLRWRAAEVAELLDTTVVSVNSALQRARSALADDGLGERDGASTRAGAGVVHPMDDPEQQVLLDKYVDAFERFDVDRLVALLHEDVTMAMPPMALWLRGHDAVRRWFAAAPPACRLHRFVPVAANGSLAVGAYRPAGPGGVHEPFALQVLETEGGRITAIHVFIDPDLFPLFDLPPVLPD